MRTADARQSRADVSALAVLYLLLSRNVVLLCNKRLLTPPLLRLLLPLLLPPAADQWSRLLTGASLYPMISSGVPTLKQEGVCVGGGGGAGAAGPFVPPELELR